MTPDSRGRTPADETYTALAKRHNELLREAGAFLARSLREGKPVDMRIAEDFAREANEVADQMKVWRLANGYEK